MPAPMKRAAFMYDLYREVVWMDGSVAETCHLGRRTEEEIDAVYT